MTNNEIIEPAQEKAIDEIISEVINKIKGDTRFNEMMTYVENKDTKLNEFICDGKSQQILPEYQLIVLRKWNSYTPLLPPSNDEFSGKGGGYFLKVKDIGIVIDPGCNFIENFFKAGFKLDDIDHVFISHAHNDHTVELEGILALLYKRNRRIGDTKGFKRIKLYMNLGSFKKFAGYFDLSKPPDDFYIHDITLLNKHQLYDLSINPDSDYTIQVITNQVKHHEMITRDYALGFTFVIKIGDAEQKVIKFTCDTGWDDNIEKINKEFHDANGINKIDVMVSHLGSIKKNELTYDISKKLKENADKLYDHHLGLIGLLASVHFWQPELVLLSEFGEELNAIRKEIAEKVTEFLKKPVFATDINFRLDLSNLHILCFKKREFFPPEKITIEYDGKNQLYPLNLESLSATEREELHACFGNSIKVF